jgi:hypothetical protein
MRGKSMRNYVAENIMASNPYQALMHRTNKWKMCWQCQKDKPTLGGHLDIKSGLHKFVCADCMAAKKAKHEVPTVPSAN